MGILFLKSNGLAFQAIHELYPTGDVIQDTVNIQSKIDVAAPGDTLILKAGTFVLGKAFLDEVVVKTDSGEFDFSIWSGNTLYQNIDIKKALTIKGETTVSGELLTKIKSFNWGGTFVINASSVVIKNLRFENFDYPIAAFSAGFDICDCEFFQSGYIDLIQDLDFVYPNYPDTTVSVRSFFRNNKLIDCFTGLWIYGSEITISNNSFELFGFGIGLILILILLIVYFKFIRK